MIEKFEMYFPKRQSNRMIHLYLPQNYYAEGNTEAYPVMYMYDGHNLYNDQDATYGTSWGLEDFANGYDKPMIIVGIECSHNGQERMNEYCPYHVEHGYFGPLQGYGDEFMEWLIHEVKPVIDQNYRTYPWREATAIGGSSMGGLMAFYSVVKYNQYFSKAAVLSPSISLCMSQLKEEWNQVPISDDTRVYFSFGEREIRNRRDWALRDIGYFNDALVAIGGKSYIHVEPNGGHDEMTWRHQNGRYMDFLWK